MNIKPTTHSFHFHQYSKWKDIGTIDNNVTHTSLNIKTIEGKDLIQQKECIICGKKKMRREAY